MTNTKTKNKKNSSVAPICHCEEQGDEAIHKLQKVNIKNKKEKELITIC